MRNGLVQLGAWAAATGAAVALSWLGVHAVLTGDAFEQPTALPLPSAKVDSKADSKADNPPHPAPPSPEQPRSATESTTRPAAPAPNTTTTTTTATTAAPTSPATAAATTAATAPHGPAPATTVPPQALRPAPTAAATSTVRSYPVPGGKVALDLKDSGATLVSATPDPGWQMQVWTNEGWLRVDFTRGTEANSVIASWNGHPPTVETVVR
ncbi:hypothetical protein [Kitasatospora brasiliensis]|uniref:hypothetical protein n=1 Tax=Kitasatospora brasiliensis TaxID=3058040 RepID=UPI00292D1B80|nr:hypothetical protein [Kitasatospora sp. K002]